MQKDTLVQNLERASWKGPSYEFVLDCPVNIRVLNLSLELRLQITLLMVYAKETKTPSTDVQHISQGKR